MKKTLTMLAILLTICLAASAYAGPKSFDEIKDDNMYLFHLKSHMGCIDMIVFKEAPVQPTSSKLTEVVMQRAMSECRTSLKMAALRMCELMNDPSVSACQTPDGMNQYIQNSFDMTLQGYIRKFDNYNARNGLPPRPSFDK